MNGIIRLLTDTAVHPVLGALLAIAVLAGWAICRIVRVHLLSDSLWDRLILYWLLGFVFSSALLTVFAVLGWFRSWALGGAGAALLCVGIWRAAVVWRRPQFRASCPPAGWKERAQVLAAGCVLIGALILFSRPTESYIVRGDAGTYTIGGMVLAQTGSLAADSSSFLDTWAGADPSSSTDNSYATERQIALLRSFGHIEHTGLIGRHYGSFYQRWISGTSVETGFLPLPKAWIALAVLIGGQEAAPWASPFVGLTAIAAMMVLLRCNRHGWGWAALGGALLACCLPQIWFSRLSTSDIYAQALILVALSLPACMRTTEDEPSRQVMAWSGGLALALLGVCRFEAIALVSVLLLALYLYWHVIGQTKPPWSFYSKTAAVGLTVSTLLSLVTSHIYLASRLQATLWDVDTSRLCGLLLAGTAGVLWIYRLRKRGSSVWLCPGYWSCERLGHLFAAMGLVSAIIVAHALFKPGINAAPDWVLLYAGWPAMVLCLIGLLWSMQDANSPEVTGLVVLGLVSMAAYSVSPMVNKVQPWATRRLLPAVFPALVAMECEAIARVSAWLGRKDQVSGWFTFGHCLLVVSLIAISTMSFAPAAHAILLHREHTGEWDAIARLQAHLSPGAVVFLDESGISDGLTQPLEYFFAFAPAVIRATPGPSGEVPIVDKIAKDAINQDIKAYYVVTNRGGWRPQSLCLEPIGAELYDVPELALTASGELPRTVLRSRALLDIYEISPTCSNLGLQERSQLPIGAGSYPYLLEGFYMLEIDATGNEFRWASPEATLRMPEPPNGNDTLELIMSGWRPDGEDMATVSIYINDVPVKQVSLPSSGQATSTCVAIQPATGKDVEVRLVTNPWNARVYSNGKDVRDLGVALYSAQWVQSSQCDVNG